MLRYALYIIVVASLMNVVYGQERFTVERDLSADWMTFDDGEYFPVDERTPDNTVYFHLDFRESRGRYLAVECARPFFIFFNGRLAGEHVERVMFSIDSLAEKYSGAEVLVAIHQRNLNTLALRTSVLAPRVEQADGLGRPATWMNDFVIFAGLLIIVYFVAASRLNPKLAGDYLDIANIVALKDAEDSHANARLTNSSNLQFYLVCSLLLGYYLFIVFQYLPLGYTIALHFKATSFWSAFGQWLKLSLVVFVAFAIKIALVFALTRLFDMRGLTRVHFFNWMRMLLVTMGGATVVLFLYYVLRGRDANIFAGFLTTLIVVLIIWVVVLFLKLFGRRDHSMFHLFSYICATELIPLFVTIKVFFR